MTAPKSALQKSGRKPARKPLESRGAGTDAGTARGSAAAPAPLADGADDDRARPPAASATRSPDSATDRARDTRLVHDLEANASGSVADRHRQGLTAIENEEDDLPQDLDAEPGDGLPEPTAPGAEDDDLSGAVTQERVESLDPDYRDGGRRKAGHRVLKDD